MKSQRVWTQQLANAAATDAANRQMRASGRTIWNEEDYNLACRVFERLFPQPREGREP